jgi:hypothetical protein
MPDIDDQVLSRPIPRQRRTKAQIAADNAAATSKKLAKAEEAKSKQENTMRLIESIATLENKMDNDEKQAEKEAAQPPAKKTVTVPQSNTKCKNSLVYIDAHDVNTRS